LHNLSIEDHSNRLTVGTMANNSD